MRNLLLVKTSENPEEAIDVSSENLKLLKEESEMVDVETLMRYIRIFFLICPARSAIPPRNVFWWRSH